MIGPLAAAALLAAVGASPAPGWPRLEDEAYGPRIAASAAAAEALQGPLDGTWRLYDGHGHPLYVLQITDPAGGAGPLEGAWRGVGTAAAMGLLTGIVRRGERLAIAFAPADGGGAVKLALNRRDVRAWRGWLTQGGRRRWVTLARGDEADARR